MGREARANPHSMSSEVVLDPVVLDRLNRAIGPGDLVLLSGVVPAEMLWRVDSLQPVVDPRQPANLVRVRCVCEFGLMAAARQPVREILQIVDDSVEPIPPPPAPISDDPPSLRAWARYKVNQWRSERG